MIWLLGSTGLTGHFVAEFLEHDTRFDSILAPVRKRTEKWNKINEVELNFGDDEALNVLPNPTSVLCCIGTTIKKAGSQEAFKQIDYDLVLRFAKIAKAKGAQQFILVSSIGANSGSSVFYLRIKGELENAIRDLGFSSTLILQPAALMGNRNEARPGETIGIALSSLFSPLLFGPFKNYRPIKALDVAKVIHHSTKHRLEGFHIFASSKIQHLANSLL